MSRYILYILFLLLFLNSCKVSKVVVDEQPVPNRSDIEILNAVSNHNFNFTWFAGDAKLKVDSPSEDVSAKVYLRLKKDSIIWATVKKVSVEGGRVLINPNMYALINRLDGTYTRGKTSQFTEFFGIGFDFYDIQEALFGNVILPDTANYKIERSDGKYILLSMVDNLNLKYIVDGRTLQLDQILVADSTKGEIEVIFDDYKKVQEVQNIAFKRSIKITDSQNLISIIEFNFNKLTIDIPKSTKFSIPPHYEEVPSWF